MMTERGPAAAEVRWHKLRREEVAAAVSRSAILLLPVGAIEQHGPHLPLDTDTNAATEVAERAARLLADPPGLVLPPIWWGLSPYWLPFAGTLSLQPETILAMIRDLGVSVSRHGFNRMVIVNGHGGNAGILGSAATQLAAQGIRAVSLSYWSLVGRELRELAPGDHGFIGHAGQTETSVQLFLQSDLVRQELAPAELCADLSRMPWGPVAGIGYVPPDPLQEAPHGIYGDAPAGHSEIGRQVIEIAASRLANTIRELPWADVARPAAGNPSPLSAD